MRLSVNSKTTQINFGVLTIAMIISLSSTCRQQKSVPTTSIDFKTYDTTLSFSGYWLTEKYIKDIRKNKSPKLAQDGSEYIYIPDRTLKKTMMIYNFHEGGEFLTVLKNETSYVIEIISPREIKIGDKNFVKIHPIIGKDIFSVSRENQPLILEEILFKGNYITADGKNVEFKNDGNLISLDNYHYYVPVDDYYDEGMQVDQIGLTHSDNDSIKWKDLEWFGFKFNEDTLALYKLNCVAFDSTSQNCGIVEYGDLIYKLFRKR